MKRCGCTATQWCADCYALAQRAGVVRPPGISERALQSAVVRIAKEAGWKVYHTFDSRKSEKGYPDLTLVKDIRLIFAELKRDGEKPTLEQEIWLVALRNLPYVETYLWYPDDFPTIKEILQT